MSDTIAAPATPPGLGGIGVIRVSGPDTARIAEALIGHLPEPRKAALTPFYDVDKAKIDSGLALYFKAPASFTGEDVLELQGHGGAVVQGLLMERLVGLGARLAEPGEFSKRAYLNGKIDLAQAEAIADLINAGTRQAARSAMRSLDGEFSDKVNQLEAQLRLLRVYCEAAIDFPDEELDLLAEPSLLADLDRFSEQLARLQGASKQGALLRDGIMLVLIGAPNVGKSSLLNRLTQRESAIVSATAGTTRDIVREQISIDGIPVTLLDTAGLRVSPDAVEAEGIKRALAAVERADVVLCVEDATGGEVSQLPSELILPDGLIRVYNKIDLTDKSAVVRVPDSGTQVFLSARTGEGVSALKQVIRERLGVVGVGGEFSARQRHLESLKAVEQAITKARGWLAAGSGELLCEELRLAHESLGQITGQFGVEALLGSIFSEFCIGK